MLNISGAPTFQRLWPDLWTEDERVKFATWLLIYAKNVHGNIPAAVLRELKREIDDAND